MRSTMLKTTRLLAALAGVVLLAACAGQPGGSRGHVQMPVLVMAEDADATSLPRSSPVHNRIAAGLKGSMARHGYTVRDEDFVAARMGWDFQDRQSKRDLIEAAKLMNRSGAADSRVRALVLYRIKSHPRDAGYAMVIRTRLEAEIYDIAGNRFLDSFELPVEKFSAPAGCDDACLSEILGARAREMARQLGDMLARKLSPHAPTDMTQGNDPQSSRPGHGKGRFQ